MTGTGASHVVKRADPKGVHTGTDASRGPDRRYDTIHLDVTGTVATVSLHRPPLNAITAQMADELYAVLDDLSEMVTVDVVVLTGSGGPGNGFCPGADIRHLVSDAGRVRPRRRSYDVPVLLHAMPQVTVAAINGAVAGAGLGWACACDLRVATASANFSTAFLRRGVAGDMALPWSLPRLVGAARARELFFTSQKFAAREALAYGLVCRVFSDAEFAEGVERLVADLAATDRGALRRAKAHFLAAERLGMADYAALETEHHTEAMSAPEVIAKFAEFFRPRDAAR